MKRIAAALILLSCSFTNTCYTQGRILSKIDDVLPDEIRVEGFAISSDQDVTVRATGFGTERHGLLYTRAWIINASDRSVVWEMQDGNAARRERFLMRFEERITLAAGGYEVYYSSFPHARYWRKGSTSNPIKRFLEELFHNEDDSHDYAEYDDYHEKRRRFGIVVRGRGERFHQSEIDRVRRRFNGDAFVKLAPLHDGEEVKQGFSLTKDSDVHIYTVGEILKEASADYGWIMDTRTRRKVWHLDFQNSLPAGGADKNRKFDGVVSLPAGQYAAFFVTDDSHSNGEWNEAPPYDPDFWGLTVKLQDRSQKNYVKAYDFDSDYEVNVLFEFTQLGDNQLKSQVFRCLEDLDLRIYAIGEGKKGEMYDYGWIIDATTHKKVWDMNYYNTEHAGGSLSNRLHNEVLRLTRGSYILYFVTDDSHSFWEWHDSPPHDKRSWGITLIANSDRERARDIVRYDEPPSERLLARLIEMHNYEKRKRRFAMHEDALVDVYAVGEGTNGDMHDYGWIETADSKKVVWEMTYRRTEHAGGAKKNRSLHETIFLKEGDYILNYQTDDSHGFDEWNASPPSDPLHWGITLHKSIKP